MNNIYASHSAILKKITLIVLHNAGILKKGGGGLKGVWDLRKGEGGLKYSGVSRRKGNFNQLVFCNILLK